MTIWFEYCLLFSLRNLVHFLLFKKKIKQDGSEANEQRPPPSTPTHKRVYVKCFSVPCLVLSAPGGEEKEIEGWKDRLKERKEKKTRESKRGIQKRKETMIGMSQTERRRKVGVGGGVGGLHRAHSGTPAASSVKFLFDMSPMCVCVCSVAAVVSDSLRPHGLQAARLLCPWDSPGKNTGVGCHALLQGIFPTQGLNPHLLGFLHYRQIL